MARKDYYVETKLGANTLKVGFSASAEAYDEIKAELGIVDLPDTATDVLMTSPTKMNVPRVSISYWKTVNGKKAYSSNTVYCSQDKIDDVIGGSLQGKTYKGGKIRVARTPRDVSYS